MANGCQIDKKIIVTFTGSATSPNNTLGIDPVGGDNLGSKGLAVVSGGMIEIQAKILGPSFTFLTQNAVAGTSQIVVEDSVNWNVGDSIVIANTDFSYVVDFNINLPSSVNWQRGRAFPEQTELRRITAINGKVITLNQSLSYTHWGTGYERAEVASLNKYFVFQGDDQSETTQHGGHIIIRKAVYAKFTGVELFRMGQLGILGRYPIHYHHSGDKSSNPGVDYYFSHSTVWKAFQRCLSIHNTNGVAITEVAAYDIMGHCYFLEDGSERKNIFNKTLGIIAKPIAAESGRQIIPSDNEPSIYWISNPDNTFIRSSAVGGKFGFWYVMPVSPIGSSAAHYNKTDPWVRPRWTPLGVFDQNIAHGAFRAGLFIDDFLDDLGNSVHGTAYTPYL